MRWLVLLLLLQAPAAAPTASPSPTTTPAPADPADALLGRWHGTSTMTQRGQCSTSGGRTATSLTAVIVRRDADGVLRAGGLPMDYTGPVGLEWKVDFSKDGPSFLYQPKTITCGRARREVLEKLSVKLSTRADGVRSLRLSGISEACPGQGCIFGDTYDLLWQGPPPAAVVKPTKP